MRDHVDIVNGYPFDSKFFTADVGIPLVRIRDIYKTDTEVCYAGDLVPEAFLHGGEILIGMDGDFNVARWRGGEALLNQRVCAVVPRKSVNADFLFYVLPAPLRLINEFTYATTVKHLSSFDVLKIHFPFPPPERQRAIAEFLDRETARIDTLIAAKERALGLLEEKRKAVITRAVTSGIDPSTPLRDSGTPWLGLIPAHWQVKRVKYLFRLITDPAPEDNDFELLSLYTDIGVRPRKELEARGNKSTTTDNYWRVQRGDLVVNKLLAWMGAFGVSNYDGVTSPAYDILRPGAEVDPTYYHHLFRCGVCLPEIRRRSYGIMDMRLRLYFDRLGDMSVPLPPVAEQRAIVDRVAEETEKLDALRATNERSIALLKERRAALIAAAVTGNINVPEVAA